MARVGVLTQATPSCAGITLSLGCVTNNENNQFLFPPNSAKNPHQAKHRR
jgi:hypothetical protein